MQDKEILFSAMIPEKLAFLKQYDNNFQVFGSENHRYLCNPPFKVLENSYLQKPFVLEKDFDHDAYECQMNTCDEKRISFEYIENCTYCEYAENCLIFWNDTENCFRYEQGVLRLNSHGCTYYDVLVCKGVGVGKVWAANDGTGY